MNKLLLTQLSVVGNCPKCVHIFHYTYRKLGNFYVEIIHVLNIHVDLFSWELGNELRDNFGWRTKITLYLRDIL